MLQDYRRRVENGEFKPNCRKIELRYYEEIEDTGRPPGGLKILKHMIRSFPFLRGTIYRKPIGRIFLRMLVMKREWVLGEVVQWAFNKDRQWHHNKRQGIF